MISRRLALAGIAATIGTAAVAQSSTIHRVGGLYTAYGMNSDGSKYTGQVQISQAGTNIEMYWNVSGQQYAGRGVLQGSVMTIDWGASTPVIYVLVGNELHGTWDGGTALERLVRQ